MIWRQPGDYKTKSLQAVSGYRAMGLFFNCFLVCLLSPPQCFSWYDLVFSVVRLVNDFKLQLICIMWYHLCLVLQLVHPVIQSLTCQNSYGQDKDLFQYRAYYRTDLVKYPNFFKAWNRSVRQTLTAYVVVTCWVYEWCVYLYDGQSNIFVQLDTNYNH